MTSRPHTVLVIYKSGAQVTVKCSEFTVTRSAVSSGISKITWADAKPNPLVIGLDDIAAVWEL